MERMHRRTTAPHHFTLSADFQVMSIIIRDVREAELAPILALNNAAGGAILPLDSARLHGFYECAEYFRVAERDGQFAGFLIGFGADGAHESSNFRWFKAHCGEFFYIDRVVVASRRRGGGVGRAFYADVQSYAELRWPLLACEVLPESDGELDNDPVRLFHGSIGFNEIGQHVMPETGIRALMLAKELCSFPWVHARYGRQLPEVPWISRPRLQSLRAAAPGAAA